jgi:hypothetical protein
LQRRAERTPDAVQDIAWNAQKRLCARYRLLDGKGKLKVQVCTAIARELTGFIWAIGQQRPAEPVTPVFGDQGSRRAIHRRDAPEIAGDYRGARAAVFESHEFHL